MARKIASDIAGHVSDKIPPNVSIIKTKDGDPLVDGPL